MNMIPQDLIAVINNPSSHTVNNATTKAAPERSCENGDPNAARFNKKSFAEALSNHKQNGFDFSIEDLPTPCIKGDQVAVKIPQEEYVAGIEDCKKNLHGRLILSKGDTPPKLIDLKNKLQKLWKGIGSWSITPIGKGFFEFSFASQEDLRTICSTNTWNLQPGTLKLFLWTHDFNPHVQKLSHTQCWIRIHNLPQEYWRPKTLFSIAGGIGSPLSLDEATKSRSMGFYARVLVELDLKRNLPSKVLVQRDDFAFFVPVEYEHLPYFCSHCQAIGHLVGQCRKLQHKNEDMVAKNKVKEVTKAIGSDPPQVVGKHQGPANRSKDPKAVVEKVNKPPVVDTGEQNSVSAPGVAVSASQQPASAVVSVQQNAGLQPSVTPPDPARDKGKQMIPLTSITVDLTPHMEENFHMGNSSGTKITEEFFNEVNEVRTLVVHTEDLPNLLAKADVQALSKFWADEAEESDKEEPFTPVVSKKKKQISLARIHNTRTGGRR